MNCLQVAVTQIKNSIKATVNKVNDELNVSLKPLNVQPNIHIELVSKLKVTCTVIYDTNKNGFIIQ